MECVINQFFELGDILFIEPIYRHYHNLGYNITAPVKEEYIWIQEYIPYVKFVDKEKYPYDYESPTQKEDGRLHLPIRFAHPLLRGYELHYGDDRKNWMSDKYLYLQLDKELWRTMQFTRSKEREEKLEQLLQLPGEFNLVNEYFGGSFERVPITVDNALPSIYMKKIEGYTLLDWLSIVEKATNIYIVESSLFWLVESFSKNAKEYHLYPRYPFLPNSEYMRQYLSKDWKLYEM